MGRGPRIDIGNLVYHVINRSNGRVSLFNTEADYRDFEYLLCEIKEEYGMRILAYVVMPNHWHLLLYPLQDKDLSRSMHWLGTTHAHRHNARMNTVGEGHLYQGRYKSFLIEEDLHLLTVLKYIERNPVRANLVERAEEWRWSSAYRRIHGIEAEKSLLGELPVDLPRNYLEWIHTPEPSEELKDLRHCVNKGITFGDVLIPKDITP
jgi:putative transposase